MFPANAQSELPSLFAVEILLRLVVQPAHPNLAVGLGVVIGRRFSELLGLVYWPAQTSRRTRRL